MWSQQAVYQSLYMPWFMWSPWLVQSVCKVNMTKLNIHHSQFCECPYKDVETFCLILFMATKLYGRICFLLLFPYFLPSLLLIYFIRQGMQNVSDWRRSWYGKLQKVMNFTDPISLISAFCSSGQQHPSAFNDGNWSEIQDSSLSNT